MNNAKRCRRVNSPRNGPRTTGPGFARGRGFFHAIEFIESPRSTVVLCGLLKLDGYSTAFLHQIRTFGQLGRLLILARTSVSDAKTQYIIIN